MTKEEYIKKMNEDEEWWPGQEAIQEEFARLYPEQLPEHYATTFKSRFIFGGDEYLDGFLIYPTGNDCFHIVSLGMTDLYPDENAFGQEYSGWGYEMTIKLKEDSPSDCLWAMHMMSNLARYTNTSKSTSRSYFESGDYVMGDGSPLKLGSDSKLTSLIVVNDTSAKTLDTIHGKVEFLQLVGITWQEMMAIHQDISNLDKLIALMKQDNPELITDMKRTKSYL